MNDVPHSLDPSPLGPGPLSLSLDQFERPLLSPSAAHLWRRCRRKFGWRYLAGLRDPEAPGQRLGKAYHRSLERYLVGDLRGVGALRREDFAELDAEQWRTLRRIVRAALESGAYPEPRPGVVLAVEQELRLSCQHASWRGYADAILRPRDIIEVHDHKTLRSLAYALTDDELLDDPQAIFYASAVSRPGDGARVGLQWTYVQTHGAAEVRPTRCSMTSVEAHERMAALDAEVGASVAELVRTRPQVLDLAPNWSACDAYGGCPHCERCGERPILAALSSALDRPTRAEGADSDQGVPQMQATFQTFAERYGTGTTDFAAGQMQIQPQAQPAAHGALGAPAAHGAPVQHAPQPAQPPASSHPDPLAAIFAGQAASVPPQSAPSAPQAAPAPASAPISSPPAAEAPTESAGPQPGPYDAVNRPGGPSTAYPELRAAAGGAAAGGPAPTTPEAQSQPSQPSPLPTQAQAQPQQSAQPPVPSAPVPTQVPAPVQAAPASTVLTSSQQTASGYVLLVGCAAFGQVPFRRVIPFDAVVARAAAVLRERQGIQDYRFVEYGQGGGMLALAVQGALLEAQVGQGDAIQVSHLGPEWQVVGAALRAQAATVIQGGVG